MAQHALDPASSVPQELMPHVHLVSCFRYPTIPRLDPNEVAKWLMAAPHVARDKAAVFWTYLDKPMDGTVLLTWQPLQRLGVNFATDGYIWAPPEQIYKHDLQNGLLLEIYVNKAGFQPGEQACNHARRRFRLVPAPGNPNPPQIDPSLFIVHYGPADANDRIPANMIQHDERMNNLMQQRHYFQRMGQIRRKEFMLSDRVNWPSLPELTRQQGGPQMTPRGVPQQMAYPAQQTPGPPAKRARHSQTAVQQGPPVPGMGVDPAFDDDEDNTRGDLFDHLTPREISLARYKQNHEWMEEILSSPYRIHQITPSDLGLGLKGELSSLTEGIFAAHSTGALDESRQPEKAYVGRLDAGQADKFRQRVKDHIDTTKSDIEKMQAEHAKALAEFKKSSILSTKEKELRTLVESTGPEIWRLEGAGDAESTSEDAQRPKGSKTTVEELIAQVEASTGFKIVGQPKLNRVQDGGYQAPAPEPEPEPTPQPVTGQDAAGGGMAIPPSTEMSRQVSRAESQASAALLGDSDMDMGGTAAGLLDQMHTGFSSTSTPVNNFPTPQAQLSAAQSNAATPVNAGVASPAPQAQAANQAPPASQAGQQSSADVDMGGTEGAGQQAGTAPDQGTGSGDWVVVPKDGAEPDGTATGAGDAPKVDSSAGESSGLPAGGPSATATPAAPAGSSKPASAAATPSAAAAAAATAPGTADSGNGEGYDQNDFSSLGDLDTAGDALAGFDESAGVGSGGLGDDLDLQMDMDDSAFGDAYHGVGASGATPGEGGVGGDL